MLTTTKNAENGFQKKTARAELDHIINEVDNPSLTKDLLPCHHLLVNFEVGRARRKLCIYATEKPQRTNSGREKNSITFRTTQNIQKKIF